MVGEGGGGVYRHPNDERGRLTKKVPQAHGGKGGGYRLTIKVTQVHGWGG